MAPSYSISVFALIVGLALVLTVGLTIFFLLQRILRDRTTAGGACGRCGYAVEGLTQFMCPECGSDLRQVGITPSRPKSGRATALALLITLGLLAVLGCFSMFLIRTQRASAPATVATPAPPALPPMTQPELE
jgi:hypothetical protein